MPLFVGCYQLCFFRYAFDKRRKTGKFNETSNLFMRNGNHLVDFRSSTLGKGKQSKNKLRVLIIPNLAFVPNGASMEKYSAEYSLSATDEMNTHPGKKLGYATPKVSG